MRVSRLPVSKGDNLFTVSTADIRGLEIGVVEGVGDCEDFRSAADDRGEEHRTLNANHRTSKEDKNYPGAEFFRAAVLVAGFELEGEGDERFPGAGGGVEDDGVAAKSSRMASSRWSQGSVPLAAR